MWPGLRDQKQRRGAGSRGRLRVTVDRNRAAKKAEANAVEDSSVSQIQSGSQMLYPIDRASIDAARWECDGWNNGLSAAKWALVGFLDPGAYDEMRVDWDLLGLQMAPVDLFVTPSPRQKRV